MNIKYITMSLRVRNSDQAYAAIFTSFAHSFPLCHCESAKADEAISILSFMMPIITFARRHSHSLEA